MSNKQDNPSPSLYIDGQPSGELGCITSENGDDNDIQPLENIESIMAQTLNSMSLEERERSYEELHGVDQAMNETPELVATCLADLDRAISHIVKKDAYLQAERMSPDYVHNRKFRLAFLRAENFDPVKAASRLVCFLEGKQQHFGTHMLTKPILVTDLDKDAKEALEAGRLQLLPSRDRSGRIVLCDFQSLDQHTTKWSTATMVKVLMYLLLCAAEDEENQKRGMVAIVYQTDRPHGGIRQLVSAEFARQAPKIFCSSPIQICGIHLCWEDPIIRTLGRLVLSNARKGFRSRCRIHEGSHTEVLYSLMTFGIPVEMVPVHVDGTIKTTSHLKWLAKIKAKELALTRFGAFTGIDIPARFDVLIGRGKPIQQHAGNIVLRALVDEHMDEYNATKKGNKWKVTSKVVQEVKASSARFLTRDPDGWWFVVSDSEATEKVAKTFLTAGTKLNKGQTFGGSTNSRGNFAKKQRTHQQF